MHEGAQSGPAPSMGSASGCTRGSANDVTANKRFAVVSTTSPEPHKWHSAIPAAATCNPSPPRPCTARPCCASACCWKPKR